ncbi:3'-phosphatase, 5'-polynucleotide kinase [Escherichia phage EJP2]|nr:3'-phosphatase, 5'-polynucleotide kinase [Escherichia phage EJP2]
MPKLVLTVGLPGCGKSTWATEEVKKSKRKTVILNRDDIRETMFGGNWEYRYSNENEKYVQNTLAFQAQEAVKNGWDIIVANTNLNPKEQNMWSTFAKENSYTLVHQDFFKEFKKGKSFVHDYFAINAFVKHCKERNLKRLKSVQESVIDQMATSYYYSTVTPPPVIEGDGLKYYIVDIDGTLAHMLDYRSPYDETKVHLDVPDEFVISVLHALVKDPSVRIILMSGRHVTCKELTQEWLAKHSVPYHELHMRAADDVRGDDVVKYELYMQEVYNKNKRVQVVFDDRQKVVNTWRELLGLKTFQVQPGNF